MNSNPGLEGVGRAVGPSKVPRTAGRVRRKGGVAGGALGSEGLGSGGWNPSGTQAELGEGVAISFLPKL